MFFDMTGDQDQVADHCADPAALYLSFRFGSTAALKRLLADNAQDIISEYSELQNKLVSIKLPGRKPLDIHIRLDLAVILLAFTMLMVKPDHIVIRLAKVCPPGIYLDIGRKQILAMLINGALDDLVAYTKADGLLFTVDCRIGNILHGYPYSSPVPFRAILLWSRRGACSV